MGAACLMIVSDIGRKFRPEYVVVEQWESVTSALLAWQKQMRDKHIDRSPPESRGPGRPRGGAVPPEKVVAAIAELRAAGELVNRPRLAEKLSCSLSTVRRACRLAGLRGNL